ncbi:MAG: GNAT family N-acetyltransferase [Desulfobacteraceae bacterium]|jgi:GNAT superfamily N-acetyltransferase
MKSIKLKSVDSESADIIVNIHFDAVHKGNALHFYDKDILNDWSPPISEERVNEFKIRMSKTQPVVILAYCDEKPIGFGIFDKNLKRIGAIYVKAAYTGCHVGISLLKELERIAIQNGCEKLHLDSSLNAKAFYEKHGFVCIAEGFFSLPSGKRMKSVSMSKMLRR